MQLRDINKTTYRAHLRYTTFASILVLFAGALSISSLLIYVFSNGSDSNFNLNLASVVITVAVMGLIAFNNKNRPYFSEMYYVWAVKFELSHINRKIKMIEKACIAHNTVALDIMAYYYQGTRQVWSLDDNTLAMDELNVKENKYKALTLASEYTTDITRYHRQMLEQF